MWENGLEVNYCITCGSRSRPISLGDTVRIYRCSGCGRVLTVEKLGGDGGRFGVIECPSSDDEVELMRALYRKGQVWDDQVDRATRKMLRRLEAMDLVECRTLVSKRSFWAVSVRGLSFLGGDGVDR